MGSFRPATRRKLKLRMSLDGPPGSGKTYTMLRLANTLMRHMIANKTAKLGRIAIIGTEGSVEDDRAEKYKGEPDPDAPGEFWDFDICHLSSFSPSEYVSKIEEAGKAGYDVLGIDSFSHAWEGKDGVLEIADKGGKGMGWKDATPLHRRLIEAVNNSQCHVIATMRAKVEYVYQANDKGKIEPVKVGMAPVQRAGTEYEMDICASLDWSHILRVTKSMCKAVDGMIVAKPGAGFLLPVIDWLETGQQVERAQPSGKISDDQIKRIAAALDFIGKTIDYVKPNFPKEYGCTELNQLSADQGDDLCKRMEKKAQERADRLKAAGQKIAPAAVVPVAPPTSAVAESAASPEVSEVPAANGDANGHGESTTLQDAMQQAYDAPANPDDPKFLEARIHTMLGSLNIALPDALKKLKKKYGVDAFGQLPTAKAHEVIKSLEEKTVR